MYQRGAELYVLNAAMTASRRLAPGTLPDCAPDSRTVAFMRLATPFVSDPTLYAIGINGRGRERLSPRQGAFGRAAFSPSGGEVAYDSGRGIQVVSLSGKALTTLPYGCKECGPDFTGTNWDSFGSTGQFAWQPLPRG